MRIEKKVCKERFEINGVLIGDKGDVLKITDAVPIGNETYEDVAGYCDIFNETTGITTGTIWNDVEGNVSLEDVK